MIGSRIKYLRLSKNLTQLDLASLINMGDSAFRRIENGNTNPTIKTLIKIANGLNVDLVDLLKD